MFVEGKVAFVTGGAGGIGNAIIKEFLQNGAKGIAIVDIAENEGQMQELENLFRKEQIIFIKTDVTVKEELEDAFEKCVSFFKQLDIVINNAGISNEIDWEACLKVNLNAVIRGSYLALKKYLPEHKSASEGLIINTASVYGLNKTQLAPMYCVSKHAVICFGQCIGGDEYYKTFKVRVLTVCPGFSLSNMHSTPISQRAFFPKKIKEEMVRLQVQNQSFESISKGFIDAIEKGKNGSVWVVENDLPAYEIIIPEKHEMKTL